MSMNSMEEDALFEEYGWYKNLIQRRFEAPMNGIYLTFDAVSDTAQEGLEGEETIKAVVIRYGSKQD